MLFDIVKAIAAKGGRIRLVPCFAATMAQISAPDCSTLQRNCSVKIFKAYPLGQDAFFSILQRAACSVGNITSHRGPHRATDPFISAFV